MRTRRQAQSASRAAGGATSGAAAWARGGTERSISYVTEDDRKKLQESLYRTLAERLTQQLKAQLPAGDKESAIPWSGQAPAVVEATFSKNADDEAQTVALTLK